MVLYTALILIGKKKILITLWSFCILHTVDYKTKSVTFQLDFCVKVWFSATTLLTVNFNRNSYGMVGLTVEKN